MTQKLYLNELEPFINKTCQICFNDKLVNADMLWKQNIILKFIEDMKLIPKQILDIGAGCMNLTPYLMKTYNSIYTAVDIEGTERNNLLKLLRNAEIDTSTIAYYTDDFLNFNTDRKYDLIYDVCAMIHFNPTTELCGNDGLLNCGYKIKEALTEDGYFLFVSDCTNGKETNHKNEYNKEFIEKDEIINCFTLAGLHYCSEYTKTIDRETINNTKNTINFTTVSKGWRSFDHSHRNYYDVVFLVFKK
jgi:SAM-dependent methyltransferase